MKTPITFTKIVATPSISAWSQAYNAGNLAAVLALTQEPTENNEGDQSISADISLASLGKELLNTLEAEYFTLETKNLNTIKQAIVTTCEKVTDAITASLMVSVIIENVLYVFIYGNGKILMKRSGKLGTLLEQQEKGHLTAASGFIQNGDIVILETEQFANIITTDVLLPCLEHDKLSEIGEVLSPIIHEKQEGSAAALAFSYREDVPLSSVEKDNFTPVEEPKKKQEETPLPSLQHKRPAFEDISQSMSGPEQFPKQDVNEQFPQHLSPKRFGQKKSFSFSFTHKRRLFLTIAIVVVLILGASIYFSVQKQRKEAMQQLFTSTITPAQKKYDEGESLIDVNKNLAKQDFQGAKDMLNGAAAKFPKGSPEEKQINDLSAKIDAALAEASQINSVDAKETDFSNSDMLSALNKHADEKYATMDDKNIYLGNNDNITAIAKSTNKEKIAIKADWKDIGGLGAYLGNLYVVDKKGGILKYVGGTTKANYFTGSNPDMSNIISMAIDGSVWLLDSSGNISKYTRGKSDNLTLKSLDTPLSSPTRIFTSVDMNNVYVLDNGNKRVVVFDKSGNYVSQYQSNLLGQAQDLDVVEKNKKLYVLANSKLYEIDLK